MAKKQQKKIKRTGHHPQLLPGMNLVQSVRFVEKADVEAHAKDELQMVLRDRQAQRMGWLYLAALNGRFGFGTERIDQLEQAVQEAAAEYGKMAKENGQYYADEKLRQEICKLRGREIPYAHADKYPVNDDRPGEDPSAAVITATREAADRIY